MNNPCVMLKANGQPCTVNAWRGINDTHPHHLHFCGIHKNSYRRMTEAVGADAGPPGAFVDPRPPVHHTAGRCLETVRIWDGAPLRHVTQWCPNAAAAGSHLCTDHAARQAARAQRDAAFPNIAHISQNLLRVLVETQPFLRWRDAIRVVAAMNDVPIQARKRAAFRYYQRHEVRREMLPQWRHAPAWRFEMYWEWVIGGRQGPEPDLTELPPHLRVPVAPPVAPPPPRRELQRLAADTQNVHTRVVTDQTNAATDKLLSVVVPDTQQTEKTMSLVWLGSLSVSYGLYLRVANDVNRWFNTKDCRAVGDHLYRKLLRGAVAIIVAEKDDERKMELYRRLWEECYESVGMCCEGHISRLCNVFVGFDEAFQTPVPFGEILQNKMAAIAGLDIPDEEKRRQANAFFDEHKIPAEERAAWLDAF